jgi:Zc3h12a-like Ribonuclease NYN domain/S1 RNA binding domain
MPVRHVVVDGSNIATEGRNLPNLAQLDQAVREFLGENPEDIITVVVDASFAHRIDPAELPAFEEAEAEGEVVSPPAGAIGRGDAFLLRIAEKTGATVLSNDSFQEFHGEHDWLFDRGRLIGGKPVPGVGWIFTPRTPVRGIKSREAVKEAKRKKRDELPVGSAVEATGLEEAASRGKGRGRKVDRAIAVATEEAVETDEVKRRRRRGTRDTSAEPVNEPLGFITFIAAHPLGAEVAGTVDVFSSHGAYVMAEGVRCYIPLSAMGSPPPRSAREVMSKGETQSFVVQALDPMRRGIELALPGFAHIASAPTDETVEAEILGGGGEVDEYVEEDFGDRTESPGRNGSGREPEAATQSRSRSSRRGGRAKATAEFDADGAERAGGKPARTSEGADGSLLTGAPIGESAASAAGLVALEGAEPVAPRRGRRRSGVMEPDAAEAPVAQTPGPERFAGLEGGPVSGAESAGSRGTAPSRRRRRSRAEAPEEAGSTPPMAPVAALAGPVSEPGFLRPRRNPARTGAAVGAAPPSGTPDQAASAATERVTAPATAEPALPEPGSIERPGPEVSVTEPSVPIQRAPGRRPAPVPPAKAPPLEEAPGVDGGAVATGPPEGKGSGAAHAGRPGDGLVAPGQRARKSRAPRKAVESPAVGSGEAASSPRKASAAKKAPPRKAASRKPEEPTSLGGVTADASGEAEGLAEAATVGDAPAPEKASARGKAAAARKAGAPGKAATAGKVAAPGKATAPGRATAAGKAAAADKAAGARKGRSSEAAPGGRAAGALTAAGDRAAGEVDSAAREAAARKSQPAVTSEAGKKAGPAKKATTSKASAPEATAKTATGTKGAKLTEAEAVTTPASRGESGQKTAAKAPPAKAAKQTEPKQPRPRG